MSAGDTQPPPRVLLVSPPWTSLNEPSLGLSILSAVLDKAAIPCRVHHLNLFALDWLRAETYAAIARVYALNDFVFSGLLDPEVTPHQLRLLREKCSELVGSAGYADVELSAHARRFYLHVRSNHRIGSYLIAGQGARSARPGCFRRLRRAIPRRRNASGVV
jgi:hypothetical protein